VKRAALACFALGAVLLIPFDEWWTLTLGIGLLVAFVVLGTLVLTGPDAPEGDEEPA